MGERVIMNREILFKAKRLDNGEWVEGDFQHIKYDDVIWIVDVRGEKCYRCDSGTLCQYTGLNDSTHWEDLTESEKESFLSNWNYQEDRKNKVEDWKGKKIWENDIISRTDLHAVSEPSVGFIEYDLENTSFLIHWVDKVKYSPTYHWENRLKVIGNIFDNPELLEE